MQRLLPRNFSVRRAPIWIRCLVGCLALIAVTACDWNETHGETEPNRGSDTDSSGEVAWNPDACDPNAPVIGEPDTFSVQTLQGIAWDFEPDPEFPLSVAEHEIELQVPEDLVGLVITIDDPEQNPGMYYLSLDDQIVSAMDASLDADAISKSTYYWDDTFSAIFPSNGLTELTDRKCIKFMPLSIGADATAEPEITLTSVRRSDRAQGVHLDIQARIVDGALDAHDIELLGEYVQDVFSRACEESDECLRPHFTDHFVEISTTEGTGQLDFSDGPRGELRREIAALTCDDMTEIDCEDAERGINIVLVNELTFDALGPGLVLLGMAGGIPAAPFDGTLGSSLFIAVEPHIVGGELSLPFLAETIAHELGHTLGLFHTTEQEGDEFDAIADTPECDRDTYGVDDDGRVSYAQCKDVDGDNLMFWEGGVQGILTEEQMMVLRSHPLSYREE